MRDWFRKIPLRDRNQADEREVFRLSSFTAHVPQQLLALLLLQLALFCGYLIHAPNVFSPVSEGWRTLFFSMATLCLGFGACALFFSRVQSRQADGVREQYDALRARADRLITEVERSEREKSR